MDNESDDNYLPESVKYKKLKDEAGFSSTAETKHAQLRAAWPRTLIFCRINSRLYKKYSSSQNYYYIKDVNDILSDARTQAVIHYKQLMDLDTESEQVRKFVDDDNYIRKMRGLVDYYRFHKEIPRIFAKHVYDMYFDHHDRKRKVEYVTITRNLKLQKSGEDPKKALEEKLRRQRSKKFEPYLKGLPEYTFIQQYYHRKPQDFPDESRTFFSVFDKLHRVVNCSKLSNQSFMQTGNLSVHNSFQASKHIADEDDEAEKQQKLVEHIQKLNFAKKKPEAKSKNQKLSLSPSPDLDLGRKVVRGIKDLKLDVEEIKSLRRITAADPNEKDGRKNEGGMTSKLRSRRAGSNPKENSEAVETRKAKSNKITNNSLKLSRKSENDKKRLSRERKEVETGSLFDPKNYWKSIERSMGILEEPIPAQKPRSLSRKKKKAPSDSLKKSINFNFNWTKVNKILTNPLLINKSLAQNNKALTQRDKPEVSTKNYLDQKSKVVKGYHHKVNSMLLTHIQNDPHKDPAKLRSRAGEAIDVFSRKNSFGEVDFKALFTSRERPTKPKFISHSKKNSIYNISNPQAGPGKKKPCSSKRKKKKTPSTGITIDSNNAAVRTFHQASQTAESQAQDSKRHPASSADGPLHKHTKSEPEKLFHLNVHKKDTFVSGASADDRGNPPAFKTSTRFAADRDIFGMKKKSHNLLDFDHGKK